MIVAEASSAPAWVTYAALALSLLSTAVTVILFQRNGARIRVSGDLNPMSHITGGKPVRDAVRAEGVRVTVRNLGRGGT